MKEKQEYNYIEKTVEELKKQPDNKKCDYCDNHAELVYERKKVKKKIYLCLAHANDMHYFLTQFLLRKTIRTRIEVEKR